MNLHTVSKDILYSGDMIKHTLLSAFTSLPTSLLQTMEHVFYYGICPINESNQRPQAEVAHSIPILSGLHGPYG